MIPDNIYFANSVVKAITTSSAIRIEYDIIGRKVQEIGARQYNPAFDGLNSTPANNTYSDKTVGQRYAYYTNGNVQSVTDAENNTTTFEYDVYGNVIKETKPNLAEYSYQYDCMNRPTNANFKENSTSQSILLGSHSYEILAGGVNNSFITVDTETKYLNTTESAITITKKDFAGRVVEQQLPANPNSSTPKVFAEYNKIGQQTATTDANGNKTYFSYNHYDASGHRYEDSYSPIEGEEGSILYSYKRVTYNDAGRKIEEKVGNEKVDISSFPTSYITTTYTYYADGRVQNISLSNGANKYE